MNQCQFGRMQWLANKIAQGMSTLEEQKDYLSLAKEWEQITSQSASNGFYPYQTYEFSQSELPF